VLVAQGLYHSSVLFLAWLTEGARLFARLPYAAVQLPPFPLWVLLGYYAIVVGGWLWNAAGRLEMARIDVDAQHSG
jgi:hypothetical protein